MTEKPMHCPACGTPVSDQRDYGDETRHSEPLTLTPAQERRDGVILNYTTKVSVGRTLGEIQSILANHDARSILTEYEAKIPVAVSFIIPTQFGDRGYRLPADAAAVRRVLIRQRVQSAYQTPEHAQRVAWRILKDWLEAQAALIEAGLATLDQVMLPYQLEGNRTVYEALTEWRLTLPASDQPRLLPGKDDKRE